jgi:hypothetical protein
LNPINNINRFDLQECGKVGEWNSQGNNT